MRACRYACIYAACKKLVPAFIRDCERAIKQIRMEFHDEKRIGEGAGWCTLSRSFVRPLARGNCTERAIDEKASFQRELITKLIFVMAGSSAVVPPSILDRETSGRSSLIVCRRYRAISIIRSNHVTIRSFRLSLKTKKRTQRSTHAFTHARTHARGRERQSARAFPSLARSFRSIPPAIGAKL